jgi:HK97 family phage prohead protease
MPITAPVRRAPASPGSFKIFTRELVLKREKDASGGDQLYIEGCASSTVIDRMGDRISLSAQEKMLQQAKNLTLWLNHSYDVPEDVFGTCEESYLKTATDPQQGECTELWIRARVDQGNPRAVKAYEHITSGTQLGFSIGASILDWTFQDTPDGSWVFVIEDVDLWEVSVVGIPANQRAYIESAAKALRKAVGNVTKDQLPAKHDEYLRAIAEAPPAVSPRLLELARTISDEQRAAHPDLAKLLDEIAASAGPPPATEPDLAPTDVPGIVRAASSSRALSDDQVGTLKKAMQNIVDAAGHGVCTMAAESLQGAHQKIASVMPEDSEYPAWEQAAATGIDLRLQLDNFQRLETRAVKLVADMDDLDRTLEAKRAELLEIEARIATRGAIPLGRRSATYSGGSYGKNTTDPNLRRRSVHEITQDLARASRGESDDPRLRSISR